MSQNLRLSIRNLARDRGFAVTAALTLALGIGLSAAVLTVAETLLVRGLPMRDQARLVVLWGEAPDRSFTNYPLSFTDARDFSRRSRTLEHVAFFSYHGAWATAIRDGDNMSRLRQSQVSGEFFDVLGTRPAHGRALRAEDDVVGATPVAVLSYGAWQRMYGGSAGAVGKQIVVHGSGVAHTIVGVMPQGLDYPRGADFWVPLVPATTRPGTDSTTALVNLVGRLGSNASASVARDELTAFFGRPEAPAWRRNVRGVVNPLPRLILGDVKPALIAFVAACALLLLITCINVANLLLVRGMARVREIAVRSALGAERGQIIAQLLIENAVLAIAGGALGVVVAAGAVKSFVAFAPASIPRLDEIQVNSTALAGALAITAVAMLLFGLAPAVMTSRVELQEALRSGARESASRASRLATEALVVGQIALAVLVLSAAGLIVRSLVKLERADLAFERSHVLIGELAFRYDQVDNPEKQRALLDRLLPAVRALPGVRSASPVVAIPFSGLGGWDGRPASEGQTVDEASRNPWVNMEVVVPDYFTTFGISMLRGRAFTEEDRQGAAPVVVLSESAARGYWGNENPIGKRVRMGPRLEHSFTVVGIVPDTRYRELRTARPSIYFPLDQSIFPFAPLTLAIRTTGEPAGLVPALRRAIGEIDPGVALASAAPFDTYLDGPLEQPRLNALLLAVFAGAAVALAAIGLFGVMATMVRQRTRELGIRLALGATVGDLRRMVMKRGLAIAAAGTGLGLAGALGANRLMTAMLYDVSPTDGVTFATAAGLLFGVAAVATAIPASSGTRIDPVLALRVDG